MLPTMNPRAVGRVRVQAVLVIGGSHVVLLVLAGPVRERGGAEITGGCSMMSPSLAVSVVMGMPAGSFAWYQV